MDRSKWTRHTIAVPEVTRTVDSWKLTNEGPKRVEYQEMVHMHDVYRETGPDGKAKEQLWHRGCKVG